MVGLFVTLEGGEGAGKSTHAKRLAARLEPLRREIVVTREPGGTPEAEQLRSLLVSGDTGRWSPSAEALLNYAARESHLGAVIRPALARNAFVICDRFMDSTRAYQGYAGGCDLSLIDALEKAVVGTARPDLTLIFDLPPEVGLARAKGRGDRRSEDRYERKGIEFHEKLRQGFLEIQRRDPLRCKLIDASLPIDAVADTVWDLVSKAL